MLLIDRERVRVISINPDLTGEASPVRDVLYQIERVLYQAALRQQMEYIVLGGIDAVPPSDFPVPLVPCLIDKTNFSLDAPLWPGLWQGRESRELCDAVLLALERFKPCESAKTRTAFFLYHGHPVHIPSLIRLGLALNGASPIVINLYHLHEVYGLNRPTRVPWLRTFLDSTRDLRRAANLHLRVDSTRLADLIREDTGEDVKVLPFFSPMGESPVRVRQGGPRTRPIRLVYPTALPARDKGFDLIIALAERLNRPDVEIIARDTGTGRLREVCMPSEAARAGGLRILSSFMPGARYQELLADSDLVLVPYAAWEFWTRTSGVVADAIQLGKPMVGTAETWIGDQIHKLNAGLTFRDSDIDDFVKAVRGTLDQLEFFRQNLFERRRSWIRKNNARAFLQAVVDAGSFDREPLGPFRRDALVYRLLAVTQLIIPFHSRVAEPCRLALHRINQQLRGRSGNLLLIFDPEFKGARDWSKLPGLVWRTRGVKRVELRLDAPDGFLVGSGGATGSIWMTWWISSGRQIYLQDVSDGKPLLARHTLARRRFRSSSNQINDGRGTNAIGTSATRFVRYLLGLGTGKLTVTLPPMQRHSRVEGLVSWVCNGISEVDVFVGEKLFTQGTGSGTAETGPWISDGTIFSLYERRQSLLPMPLRLLHVVKITISTPQQPVTMIGRARRALLDAAVGFADTAKRSNLAMAGALWALRGVRQILGAQAGRLTVTTPPIQQETLVSTVAWDCLAEEEVEVRIGGLRGALFASKKGPGTASTGPWVREGTTFLLLSARPPKLSPILRLLDACVVSATPSSTRPVTPSPVEVPRLAAALPPLSRSNSHFSNSHLLSKVLSPREWGVVPPFSSGEVYLLAAHARAFLDRYGGDRLVIFSPPGLLDILRLFPDAPVARGNLGEIDAEMLESRRQMGRLIKLNYGHVHLTHCGPLGRYSELRAGFTQLFLQEAGLRLGADTATPRVTEAVRDAALARMRALGLPEGRTVLLAPKANSQPAPPSPAWQRIIDTLRQRGFSVATNCGPGEIALPGTVPWTGPLSELYATAEIGGFLVSARSGLCELCCTSKAALHIIQRDWSFVPFPGITLLSSLADNGLPDNAVYHIMQLDEGTDEFADRVLAHKDFMESGT